MQIYVLKNKTKKIMFERTECVDGGRYRYEGEPVLIKNATRQHDTSADPAITEDKVKWNISVDVSLLC